MENIRQHFARELARALEQAGLEAKPAVLEREFNLRFRGEPVTYHGVRRWLQGETLPTIDKLQLLSSWLGVIIEPFIPASRGYAAEEQSLTYAASQTDQDVIQAYLCLDENQRKAVAQIIFLLAKQH